MRSWNFILIFFFICMIASCKPSIPSKYLQPEEMADILYDYHIAEGIVQSKNPGDPIAMRAYKMSILENRGVSEAEFDSSLVYYTRHTQMLEDVYTRVTDRLNNESGLLGGASIDMDGGIVSSSDTTNIWSQSKSFVLSPYAATNSKSFELKADSSYHEGDIFILDFDAQFIYQDGMRDASVVLAVTYDNDSTEYVNNNVMSSSHYRLQINNVGRLRIKSVKGFWLLSNDNLEPAASCSTLKLLVVSSIRLVKMHTKPMDVHETTKSIDSINVDSTGGKKIINAPLNKEKFKLAGNRSTLGNN